MEPVKLFFAKSSSINSKHCIVSLGIAPDNLLLNRYKNLNFLSENKFLGMLPDILFFPKSNRSRFVKIFPKYSGISPIKLHCGIYIDLKFLNFLNSNGNSHGASLRL
ncbi:hypothetical protein VIGAN_02104000 [Vigna angularis var. angularis]|uniref:Uncharacterized protein n=1 Tax=Vigna angularis var. angularis TaxID=157739 RepID=A0A0S3RCD6_PHAAN|nr:hypothetical protein VIGAN_02104000 [Vigna angularis var. angularis]